MPRSAAQLSYLSTGQAAQQIGMSSTTLLRAVKNGAITPALRTPGGRLRFTPASVEHFARQVAAVAHRDPGTGLPNRILFQDRFEQALLTAHRERLPLAVVLLDLQQPKQIKGRRGRGDTDRLAREVAARLQGLLRASDTIARLGPGEFAVLLPHTDEAGATWVVSKIRAALSAHIRLESRVIEVTGRIGIAIYPDHGASAEALLSAADAARDLARGVGEGYAVFAHEAGAARSRRQALARDLRPGIAAGQLRLYYQPVVACRDGRILYAEALVRWQHPSHGLLLPDQFIPLAEQFGAITLLTLWVLEEALGQCRAWRLAGQPLGVAVNVSMLTVQESQFPDVVEALLRHYDVAPSLLTFEITETTLMQQPDQALAVLDALVDLGVRVAIDDFGIGHSSLAQLRHLPVHDLKIDRSFVREAAGAKDAALLSFILGLGNALGLTVIVEGVESQETLQLLEGLGCEAVQGFRIAYPLPAPDFDRWRALHASPEGAPAGYGMPDSGVTVPHQAIWPGLCMGGSHPGSTRHPPAGTRRDPVRGRAHRGRARALALPGHRLRA